MLLLSRKHILLREERLLFFQALEMNCESELGCHWAERDDSKIILDLLLRIGFNISFSLLSRARNPLLRNPFFSIDTVLLTSTSCVLLWWTCIDLCFVVCSMEELHILSVQLYRHVSLCWLLNAYSRLFLNNQHIECLQICRKFASKQSILNMKCVFFCLK